MLEWLQQPRLLVAVLENMQDGFSVVDVQTIQVFVNEALCSMTGYSRAELIGQTPRYPYWPEEELASIEAAFRGTLAGEAASYELTFKRKDGSRFPVIVSPSPLHAADGSVVAYFATIKDISERKRLERALADSEQRWRSIAENPFDFVVVIDRDYRYTFVNHTAPGIALSSLLGRATPFDFVEERHHAAMRDAFESTFSTGRATSYDVYVSQLDKWYSSIVGPIFERGQVASASILTREITAQKRAEEALLRTERQLRETRKMETVGTLAGGIAHDLNNMLTPILGFAELAQQNLPSAHPVQIELRCILEGAARARDLVQRILLFSRRGEPHRSVLDLRTCVAGDMLLLKGSIPANVELAIDLPGEPVLVFADRTQMGQVITNLVTNAVQALRSAGGKLQLLLRERELTADEPAGTLAGGRRLIAELVVRDSGPGMNEETRRRAFEPFFTSKPTGTGTGLGLSIVHGIVLDHGGSVSLQSAEGRGAVFVVQLPIAEPPEGESDAERASPQVAEALPTEEQVPPLALSVLCVDDEASVLALARAALQGRGHAVTSTSNPEEALAMFESTPDAFDVVVTDQTMPCLTGLELIAAIRAIRPFVPCLLITGLEDGETEQRAAALRVLKILRKPFSIEALRGAVEQAGRAAAPGAL